MRSRTWGLIAVAALVTAAVLLGVTLIRRRGPEADLPGIFPTTESAGQTPSPSPTVAATATPVLTYTVQAGDTLSAIAQEHSVSIEALAEVNNLVNPDVLQVGQVVVIPREDEAVVPASDSTGAPVSASPEPEESGPIPPTLTPSGPPLVEISEVVQAGHLETEAVTVTNEGGTVSLEGWTLASQSNDPFTFPALTLFRGGTVEVHSKDGENTPQDLYWGRIEAAWQAGGLVTLRDADGNVVDTYIVPE